MSRNPIYTCQICKLFLEKGNLNYVLDKRDGTTFLLCHDCRNELEQTASGKLTTEEFKKSIKNRWEEGIKKIKEKVLELVKQGFDVGFIRAGESDELTCDQLVSWFLVDWFNDSEREKSLKQSSDFLIILNNLEKKGKLCSNCLKFRNNLQKKLAEQKNVPT